MNLTKQEIKQKIKYCCANVTGSDPTLLFPAKEPLASKGIWSDLGQENAAVNCLSKNRHIA